MIKPTWNVFPQNIYPFPPPVFISFLPPYLLPLFCLIQTPPPPPTPTTKRQSLHSLTWSNHIFSFLFFLQVLSFFCVFSGEELRIHLYQLSAMFVISFICFYLFLPDSLFLAHAQHFQNEKKTTCVSHLSVNSYSSVQT